MPAAGPPGFPRALNTTATNTLAIATMLPITKRSVGCSVATMSTIPVGLEDSVLGSWLEDDVCGKTTLVGGDTIVEVELLLVIEVVEETVEELLLLTDVSWLVVVVRPVGATVIGMASHGLQTAPFHPLW